MPRSTPAHRELAKLMILSRIETFGAALPSDFHETDDDKGSMHIGHAIESTVKEGLVARRCLYSGKVRRDDELKTDYFLVLTDAGRHYLHDHQAELARLRRVLGKVIDTRPPVWWKWAMQGSAVKGTAPASTPTDSRLETITEVTTPPAIEREEGR